MKKFLSVIAYRSVYGIIYSVSLIPMSLLYGFSSFMYVLAYHIFGYRKAVVIQNISRSFPEKKYGEVRDVVRKFYVCFTAYFVEIIKSISIPPQKLDRKLIFENLELIDNHIRSGKNVIVCLGHCGNWEMLNFMPYKLSCDMYAVYKPLKSKIVNLLMIKLRSRFGMKLIPDKSIVRNILTEKESSAAYLFLADQCPRIKDEKYKFDLLNQITYHFSGIEKIARISKSAVVYLNITSLAKGSYKIRCISLCEDAESTNEGYITQEYINLLTLNIKEEPHGWLWSHKRWKK